MKEFKTNILEATKALPIMSHYNESQLITSDADKGTVPKNVVPWYFFIRLLIFGGLGAAFLIFALPIIAKVVGITIGVIISGALVFGAIMFAPLYRQYLIDLSKFARKKMLDGDLFGRLRQQKEDMKKSIVSFVKEMSNMSQITNRLFQLASENETKANDTQKRLTELDKSVEKLKTKIADGLAREGEAYKETPEYNKLSNEYRKSLAESNRSISQLKQYTDFTEAYGVKANLFKKVGFQMETILTAMEIKVDDFDASITMLKEMYDMAKNLKSASESANRAMGLTKSWEVDYVLETVNLTIGNDISTSVGYLNEIGKITKELNLNMDNEASYERLKAIANDIDKGINIVAPTKKYHNPDYQFTQEDKAKAGAFGSLMD